MRLILLLLALVAFPLLEIWGLVQLGRVMGLWLLALLAASAFLGWALIRGERRLFAARLERAHAGGDMLLSALLDSGRQFLAGALLLFPGVVSDVLALIVLVLPWKSLRSERRDEGVIEGEYRRLD
ncbi:FxsA family protein [Pelomicrobium methylotrophicum]|uniref:FxsA family protein n=1 Tax=Pelomicrobium methylotrophicum TaxID=2602750 RepID=A0A5C7EHM5_9PROT|nr:FxsA family protein [Pelomicrobium methylotrophicum]TXF10814.1 FxsA family protein [Pelomicrobium methylotrophicum]